jgi:hypothetical protein
VDIKVTSKKAVRLGHRRKKQAQLAGGARPTVEEMDPAAV